MKMARQVRRLLIVICTACYNAQGMDTLGISLLRQGTLKDVPSGSEIIIDGGRQWIISDDASGIFYSADTAMVFTARPLYAHTDVVIRMDKKVKRDYEAGFRMGDNLYLFGSGSNMRMRNSLMVVSLSDSVIRKSRLLDDFYYMLRRKGNIAYKDWNVEGAVLHGNRLLIFNRGSNTVFTMAMQDFVAATKSHNFNFPVGVHHIQLPEISGVQAHLSGASILREGCIVFTASAEDTKSWVEDGSVAGSLIGIMKLQGESLLIEGVQLLRDVQGNVLRQKLEGVAVLAEHSNGYMLRSVADNDDGTTEVLDLKLVWP